MVLWRPTRSSRTNTKKDVLFIIGNWNTKVGSQKIPGVTGMFGLGVQNEAGQRLTQFLQENTLVIANTLFQQHKRWLYTWTSPDSQYQNQADYILCRWRWRNSIQSAKTWPGADCGSDHVPLNTKFRLKLKKVRKTTRPFTYDLKSNPLWLTVKLMHRFERLDSVNRVPEELGMEVCNTVQGVVTKTIPKIKRWKKTKWLSEEALQIVEERREAKGNGERERHTHLNAELQRIARKDKTASLNEQC